jgi:site-specific recombinase XerD
MSEPTPAASNDVEAIQVAWLAQRANPTTASVYQRVLRAFRRELRSKGLDLDSNPQLVGLAAQAWAGRNDRTPKTYRWRLDILSSFYRYARSAGMFSGENPIDLIARFPLAADSSSQPLEQAEIRRRTVSGRRSLSKQRDQAILSVAQITGRHSTELASLRWSHVQIDGEVVLLAFRSGRQGTVQREMLPFDVGRQLVSYFQALYGPTLDRLPPDAPIWPSFARNQDQHQALSSQAIAKIIRTHLKCS